MPGQWNARHTVEKAMTNRANLHRGSLRSGQARPGSTIPRLLCHAQWDKNGWQLHLLEKWRRLPENGNASRNRPTIEYAVGQSRLETRARQLPFRSSRGSDSAGCSWISPLRCRECQQFVLRNHRFDFQTHQCAIFRWSQHRLRSRHRR